MKIGVDLDKMYRQEYFFRQAYCFIKITDYKASEKGRNIAWMRE